MLLCLAYSVQIKLSAFNNLPGNTGEFQKSRKFLKNATFQKCVINPPQAKFQLFGVFQVGQTSKPVVLSKIVFCNFNPKTLK